MAAGLGPILLNVLFQGVMVGFSEEMVFRPAVHLPLGLQMIRKDGMAPPSGGRRSVLSPAMLVTALLFGLYHMTNVAFGAPVIAAAAQSAFAAFIGLLLGFYYERSRDYIGAAVLHNALDVSGYLAALLVAR